MFREFREFAMRGNVVDIAVGLIIGAAFATIIRSLVDDVLMPPVGLALGGVDFASLMVVLKEGIPPGPYASLADAQAAGAVSINYGVFFNTIISFLIVAFAVFMLIRTINRLRRSQEGPVEVVTKECSFCASAIPLRAVRCPHCTSELAA